MLEEYINLIKVVCEANDWKKDWSHGGCYIYLEVSEFIEALRGKGDPVDELGDVLFTVLAVADHYDIDFKQAIYRNIEKHTELLRRQSG